MDYEDFVARKRVVAPSCGIADPPELSPKLFPFQADIVRWALRRGRAAIFAECGLGKTPMQLEWARHVAAHTALPVLIFAPLAVAHQTKREGEKFSINVTVCREPEDVRPGVNIVNYERYERFDPALFGGVVLDESSILKSYMGKTKVALLERFAGLPFRLACTATPAPNDHMELGNHAEFLGVMRSGLMLARWFLNDTSTFGTYVLKGHARESFWDWVATWARCVGAPSDLGYSDEGFVLPPLTVHTHAVSVDVTDGRGDALFRIPEMSATSVHKERRRTAPARAAKVAELVRAEPEEQWLIWAETDYDAAALRAVLPDAVEVKGGDSEAHKESALLGFADGAVRTLITKAKIAGFGMNWQNCARAAFVGPGFSYESFYQAIRRNWRFGQMRAVDAHVIMATTEAHIWDVVSAKAEGHSEMKSEMFAAMRRAHLNEAATQRYHTRAVKIRALERRA